MDSYKTAILRILVKRHRNPVEICSLIDGFPSHFRDEVSASLLYLYSLGYVSIYHSPAGNKYVSLNLQMKKEALRIVNPESSAPQENIPSGITKNLNTYKEAEKDFPEKERISSVLSTRRLIIGAILLISAVSMWPLLTAYNHPRSSDALYNKINDIHGLGVNMPTDKPVKRNSDFMLVSGYIIGPPYDFAVIQAEYPGLLSTSTRDNNPHNLIIEQIDSGLDTNSVIKIISDKSHKYRV